MWIGGRLELAFPDIDHRKLLDIKKLTAYIFTVYVMIVRYPVSYNSETTMTFDGHEIQPTNRPMTFHTDFIAGEPGNITFAKFSFCSQRFTLNFFNIFLVPRWKIKGDRLFWVVQSYHKGYSGLYTATTSTNYLVVPSYNPCRIAGPLLFFIQIL